MPRCFPEQPEFGRDRHAEREVWESLVRTLPPSAALLHSVNIIENGTEREIDLLVIWPGVGIAAIEVKGGHVSYEAGQWYQASNGQQHRIKDPLVQVQDGRHMLQRYLGAQLGLGRQVRFAHLLAFPYTSVPRHWDIPGLRRAMVIGSQDLKYPDDAIREAINFCGDGDGDTTPEVAERILAQLTRPLPGNGALSAAAEHEGRADQMTRDQAAILDVLKHQPRARIIGGAGTGKTWLALEQARRLARSGKRVALLCYSRGLARYFETETAGWKPAERPAHVGMFHDLPVRWGAHHPLDPRLLTNQYYEHYLPRTLKRLAKIQPAGELFDAIVVDEGQDFGALWWESVLVCLKDPAAGGLYVFMDDDQRIFGREGRPPIEAPPFVLNENLRNTKQIAALSGALSTELAIPRGLSGPRIRLVEASAGTVIERADDAVNHLIEREGWSPQQVALLTTKRKHPVQQQDVDALGWRGYWDAFFDDKDVFYGNVLGFKGLERSVVVLAVNGFADPERAREMLYVGASRARSLLVIVGERSVLASIGGPAVIKRLTQTEAWRPEH